MFFLAHAQKNRSSCLRVAVLDILKDRQIAERKVISCTTNPTISLHLSHNVSSSLKERILVEVYDYERKCVFCNAGTQNKFGDYAVICHWRVDAISRHD